MKNTASTTATATVALEYVMTTAGMRADLQGTKGVGLNAGATYVSRYVEKGALAKTIEAVAGGKLEWKDGEVVIIVNSKKGHTARFGQESKCGGYVLAFGTKGKGVLAKNIFGDKGTLEVVSVADFAKRVQKGQAISFTRTSDGAVFNGRIWNNTVDADVVGLAYGTKDGRLQVVDVETDKANTHNIEVRGFVSGDAKAEGLALTDAAISNLIAGKVTRKGETVAKKATAKVAVKATATKKTATVAKKASK